MAISEIYVDPSIAADSGTGTIGDPYGDLEYAIKQTTFDTTNGTRINIKAGTEEVLAAELGTALADTSVSIAWVPSRLAPLIFQGYTSTAGDGGMGVISGGGAVQIINSLAIDFVSFIDLELYNTGIVGHITVDNDCQFIRCKIHDGSNLINAGDRANIIGCHLYNFTGNGAYLENECFMAFNFVDSTVGTRTATLAIDLSNTGTTAYRNIVKVDGATDGIEMPTATRCINNSVWSDGGTGSGIITSTTTRDLLCVMNNVVEGFSGAGGIGFDFSNTGTAVWVFTGNSAYNNETNYSAADLVIFDSYGTNETLTASPFTDPSTNDFSPVDTGSMKEGSTPNAFPAV